MDLELTGKRAIVTGGSRGIGLAVARALAAEGSQVALVARDAAVLAAARKTVDAVPSAAGPGRRVIAVECDTGDDDAVRDMMAAVVDGLGGADILVNAAARPNTGAVVGIDGFDPADFVEQVNVKVLGYLRCNRAVVPLMRGNGWGRIINISGLAARSSGAITGSVRNVAVAALTKNLADELRPACTCTWPAGPRPLHRDTQVRGVGRGGPRGRGTRRPADVVDPEGHRARPRPALRNGRSRGIAHDPNKCSPPVLQALLQPLYDQAIGGEQAPIRWMESWLGRISPRQALAKNAGV